MMPRAQDPDEAARQENELIDFVLHSALNTERAPGTIKLRLAAVRSHHLALGLPADLVGRARLPIVLAGLKRRFGVALRRLPVTPPMLRWLKNHLGPGLDDAVVWAAVTLGFFFLLRASELLPRPEADLPFRGLRGVDLEPRVKGGPARSFRAADEVVLTIRGSKTDTLNRGQVRNHFRVPIGSPGSDLCPVAALASLERLAPERWGAEADRYLLRWADGKPLRREELQAVLARAGAALGHPSQRFGAHSLRFGGASALWASFQDVAIVRRYGRWASDAFHTYLWDARSNAAGVATRMAQADLTPA